MATASTRVALEVTLTTYGQPDDPKTTERLNKIWERVISQLEASNLKVTQVIPPDWKFKEDKLVT